MFKSSKDQATLARAVPPKGETRRKGSKPELLALLPKNPITSPGVIAGIFAFELLYGLVLAGAMTTMKRPERVVYEYIDPPAQLVLNSDRLDNVLSTPNVLSAEDKARAEKAKAKHDEEKAKELAAAEEKARKAKKAEEERKARELADKERKEKELRRIEREKERVRRQQNISQLVANAQKPKDQNQNIQVKGAKTIGPLGGLIDPNGDCQALPEKNAVTILVPDTLHTLSSVLKVANSPRALTQVTGNFSAEVTIAGVINPGTHPIKGLDFAYQGAGLLIWLDGDNYVRLERGVVFIEGHGRKGEVLVENCNAGKPGNPADKVLKNDGPVRLRIDRKDREITCWFNSDSENDYPENNWVKIKQFSLALPSTVKIGISASNVSLRGYQPRFEVFKLGAPQENPVAVKAG